MYNRIQQKSQSKDSFRKINWRKNAVTCFWPLILTRVSSWRSSNKICFEVGHSVCVHLSLLELGIRAQVININIRLTKKRNMMHWDETLRSCGWHDWAFSSLIWWSEHLLWGLMKLGWHALMTFLFSICKIKLQMSMSGSTMWNNSGNPVHGFDMCCSNVQKLTQVPDKSGYAGAGII